MSGEEGCNQQLSPPGDHEIGSVCAYLISCPGLISDNASPICLIWSVIIEGCLLYELSGSQWLTLSKHVLVPVLYPLTVNRRQVSNNSGFSLVLFVCAAQQMELDTHTLLSATVIQCLQLHRFLVGLHSILGKLFIKICTICIFWVLIIDLFILVLKENSEFHNFQVAKVTPLNCLKLSNK